MKHKNLLQAISLVGLETKEPGIPFDQRPYHQQLTIIGKVDWLLKVVKKAKEIEDERENCKTVSEQEPMEDGN